jgi:hypothetical protein
VCYVACMARLKLKHSAKVPPKLTKREKMLGAKRKNRGELRGGAIFLPDKEHLVRMIAMKGATDDEIADQFGVSREVFQNWRKAYPSFDKALDQGRLSVDGDITYALYKNAVGYHYEEDQSTPKGGVVRVERFARGETDAQKYWLQNRRPDLWGTTTRIAGGGKGESPLGIKTENRSELIDAIVAMIAPKPDGRAKPENSSNGERVKR